MSEDAVALHNVQTSTQTFIDNSSLFVEQQTGLVLWLSASRYRAVFPFSFSYMIQLSNLGLQRWRQEFIRGRMVLGCEDSTGLCVENEKYFNIWLKASDEIKSGSFCALLSKWCSLDLSNVNLTRSSIDEKTFIW